MNTKTILRITTALCLMAVIFSLGASAQAGPEAAATVPSLNAFEQVSARTGWILFVGKLYWTNTDGVAWTNITPATHIQAVDFLDAARGWTVISASSGYSLASTRDSGKTWQTRTLRLPAFNKDGAPIAKVFMHWRTNLHGWLVFKLATGSNFSRGILFVTFDGGKSWERREVPLGEPVTFTDEDNGWVAGGPAGDQTFRTRDGGLSWESVSESRDPLNGQNEAGWKRWESGECADGVCVQEVKLLTRRAGVWESMRLPNGQNSLRKSFPSQMKPSALGDSDTSVYIGQGFDTCEIPDSTKMQTWWNSSPYSAVNLYIGGVSRACGNLALTSQFVSSLNAQGWKFIPTWVGLQAACNEGTYGANKVMNYDTTTAYNQGVNEADAAIAVAQALGLTNPDGSGTVIYFDLEHYSELNTACGDAATAFINGWSFRMRERGNLAGVYASPCNARDWWNTANMPDALWVANWYGNNVSYTPTASVYGTVCMSDTYWNNHRRLRQYAGGHSETWGGQAIVIDSDVLDGPVTVPNGTGSASTPDAPSAPIPSHGATVARTNDTWLTWKTNGDTCSLHVYGGTLDTTVATNCSSYYLGMREAGAYHWQVTATNTFGSTVGPTWQFDIQPASPSGLTADAASATRVNLTWNASPDPLDNLLVFVDGAQAANIPGSAISYQVQNLACNSSHSFYLKAVREGIQSAASATVNATTPSCAPVLVSPLGGVTDSLLPTFSWQSVESATQYLIQVSTSSAFSTLTVNTRTTATAYTASLPLTANKKYFWRVRAIGTFGNGDWASSSFTTPNPPPAPTLLAPANNSLVTNYRPRLNWQDVTPPTGTTLLHYQIQVAMDLNFTSPLHDTTVVPSEFTPPTKLAANTVFYWRVRSVNTLGHSGAWSVTWAFRTAILPPKLLSPVNGTVLLHRRPSFDWGNVVGASSYTLQISKYSNFSSLMVNTPATASNFTLPADLPANSTLYWRVRANGVNGPSLWSKTSSFTTGNPPSVPALVDPRINATIDDLTPLLIWRASTLPAGTTFDHYQLQIATNPNFTALVLDQSVTSLSPAEFTLTTPLLVNKDYYWRVRAFNTKGEYSAWSAVWYFKTSTTAVFEWGQFALYTDFTD